MSHLTEGKMAVQHLLGMSLKLRWICSLSGAFAHNTRAQSWDYYRWTTPSTNLITTSTAKPFHPSSIPSLWKHWFLADSRFHEGSYCSCVAQVTTLHVSSGIQSSTGNLTESHLNQLDLVLLIIHPKANVWQEQERTHLSLASCGRRKGLIWESKSTEAKQIKPFNFLHRFRRPCHNSSLLSRFFWNCSHQY